MKISLLLSLIVFIAGIFYWYSWRPAEIKKACFAKHYDRANEQNYEWAEGKEWVPIGYSNNEWGWKYPDQGRMEIKDTNYKLCLRKEGL
jgi:hypothetical protein